MLLQMGSHYFIVEDIVQRDVTLGAHQGALRIMQKVSRLSIYFDCDENKSSDLVALVKENLSPSASYHQAPTVLPCDNP